MADSGKPYWIVFSMDFTVFAYMAGICLLTGILFGIAPALQVSKTNVNEILKEGGRGAAGGPRARRMRSALVVAELALTVVLLIGAGLMVRSFMKLYDINLGIDTDHLLTMRADLTAKFDTPEKRRLQFESILSKVKATPGVTSASLAESIPLSGGGRAAVEIDGKPEVPGGPPAIALSITVTPEYFQTVGTTLRRGRIFEANDGAEGQATVIVNERFVARFFPGEDPLGKRIRVRNPRTTTAKPSGWLTIVGVSPTIRQGDPQALEPDAVIYRPYRQFGYALDGHHRARARGSVRIDRLGPSGDPGRGSRSARVPGADDERAAGAAALAVSGVRNDVRHLCARRPGTVGRRHLRRHVLLGDAAHAGDRRPHGARRAAGASLVDGAEAGPGSARLRPEPWADRAASSWRMCCR